jgi:hypothetical protein
VVGYGKKILSALMPELRAAISISSSLAILIICLPLAAALGGQWVSSSPSRRYWRDPESVRCEAEFFWFGEKY